MVFRPFVCPFFRLSLGWMSCTVQNFQPVELKLSVPESRAEKGISHYGRIGNDLKQKYRV